MKKKIFKILIILITFFFKFILISKNIINNKNVTIKKILLSKIFKINRRNMNNISTLFVNGKAHFGNYFISINNAIIYCEFLGCQRIIMQYYNNIYINSTIFYKERNIIIEPNKNFNSMDNNSVNLNVFFFFYNGFKYLRNINRFYIFKKQLLNNLPKIITHPNDIYIYIRSGDIFHSLIKRVNNYFQPPLCFYEKLLNIFKFRKVLIISQDKYNPVISKLLNKYSYIKKLKNNIKLDICYLINSYNLVAAKSTFFLSSIKFNKKLKFLWEYDCLNLTQKYIHLHHSVYMFPYYYTVYKMNMSKNYRKLMSPWFNTPKQRQLMIIEKCKNNFDLIRGKHLTYI